MGLRKRVVLVCTEGSVRVRIGEISHMNPKISKKKMLNVSIKQIIDLTYMDLFFWRAACLVLVVHWLARVRKKTKMKHSHCST